jgi:hypothetical protein
MSQRYVIVTLEDAKHIAAALTWTRLVHTIAVNTDALRIIERIIDRFRREEGADIEDIVARLKGAGVCAACEIEGQAAHCTALEAQKQGRRLRRLLERARGEHTEGT